MSDEPKIYVITLIPALFMTTVCSTFVFVSKQALGIQGYAGYIPGAIICLVAIAWFMAWKRKENARS